MPPCYAMITRVVCHSSTVTMLGVFIQESVITVTVLPPCYAMITRVVCHSSTVTMLGVFIQESVITVTVLLTLNTDP